MQTPITFFVSFISALFIIIGMCVHAGTHAGTPYYSSMLICFSAFLAIGGGICVILDMKGFQLKAPPAAGSPSAETSGGGPPAGHEGDPNKV